jgi:hypothetical protein
MQFLLDRIKHPGAAREIVRGTILKFGASEESLKGVKLYKALSALDNWDKMKAKLAQLLEPKPQVREWISTTAKTIPLNASRPTSSIGQGTSTSSRTTSKIDSQRGSYRGQENRALRREW